MIDQRQFPSLRREEASPKQLPLVSVVIPSYEHAHFLAQAIESVMAQTVQDFEIVVVDDGSTDDVGKVTARYDRVRRVRQKHQGLPAARNTGIRETRGPILLFLDADDRLLPRALEAGLQCLAANPGCAFVSGLYGLITAEGMPIPGKARGPVEGDHYLAFLRGNYIGMHATVMYRREFIEKVGGFDTTLPACEDYDLYLRISRRFPVATFEEMVAEYRMHDSNMSGDLALMLGTVLRVLKQQREHTENHPLRSAALQQGVEHWRHYYIGRWIGRLQRNDRNARKVKTLVPLAWKFFRLAPGALIQEGATRLKRKTRRLLARGLPGSARRQATASSGCEPAVNRVRWGDLRRLTPVSRRYGYDRGLPIDRHYIEAFLQRHAGDIHGRVLEIGNDDYTRRFGATRVGQADVLHVNADNPRATFVGDLAEGRNLPLDAFDCIILTQTLHLIYEVQAALATLARILKPGGVLLMTVPGTISQLEDGIWNNVWHWGFTGLSITKLCQEQFSPDRLEVRVHGNVLTSVAFLEGLAAGELRPDELGFDDPLYPLVITVRAEKSPAGAATPGRQ